MPSTLKWTNPHDIDLTKDEGVIYFAKVIDDAGDEYRYIGQTKRGEVRLNEYVNNVRKIFELKPRRSTPGQKKYRPVHLALAKACQNGWKYDFKPIKNTTIENLNSLEQQMISELNCNLNVKWSWDVSNFEKLSLKDIE